MGNLLSPFDAMDIVWYNREFRGHPLGLTDGGRHRGAWVAATSLEILVIAFVVGTYLAFLTETPLLFSLLYVMVGEILTVGWGVTCF